MADLYTFSLKSEEQRGASQPNIIRYRLASDDDAATFATNLESIFSADVSTVNKELASDSTLPYPDGSDYVARCDLIDADGRHYNMRIPDWNPEVNPTEIAASLLEAGIMLPIGAITAAVACNITVIKLSTPLF